jgi:xanthine dehydrogenase YagS FAD-binding subunit
VQEAERMLAGQKVTAELAGRVAEAAVAGANPLAKNGYKVALTRNVVRRTVTGLVGLG